MKTQASRSLSQEGKQSEDSRDARRNNPAAGGEIEDRTERAWFVTAWGIFFRKVRLKGTAYPTLGSDQHRGRASLRFCVTVKVPHTRWQHAAMHASISRLQRVCNSAGKVTLKVSTHVETCNDARIDFVKAALESVCLPIRRATYIATWKWWN